MSADERQNAANDIQKIIADNVYTIFLANEPMPIVLNKSIRGYRWGGWTGAPWISLNDMTRAQ